MLFTRLAETETEGEEETVSWVTVALIEEVGAEEDRDALDPLSIEDGGALDTKGAEADRYEVVGTLESLCPEGETDTDAETEAELVTEADTAETAAADEADAPSTDNVELAFTETELKVELTADELSDADTEPAADIELDPVMELDALVVIAVPGTKGT